MGLSGRD